jgi:3-hydroxyisobutyrate dehydrogenase
MQLDVPGLALAKRLYEQLSEQGHSHDGTQALFRLYEAQIHA